MSGDAGTEPGGRAEAQPGGGADIENQFAASLRGNRGRMLSDLAFNGLCVATAVLSVAVLIWLLVSIFSEGWAWLDWNFLSSPPEPDPTDAGVYPSFFGTVWVCSLCAMLTLPIGIATAILLEEFRPRSKIGQALYGIIQLNIANLAGVPSVVYGILGLTAFVSMFGLFVRPDAPGQPAVEIGAKYYDQLFTEGDRAVLIPVPDESVPLSKPVSDMTAYMFAQSDAGVSDIDYGNLIPVQLNVIGYDDPYPEDEELLSRTVFADEIAGRISDKSWYHLRLPFGRGVITGALTLMLVILPVIIISTQESLRAVSSSLRDGARGLGATPWQVVWNVTLPAATPGIMTGSILAMSRAIGETAPILIVAGGIVYVRNPPHHLMDSFTVMPLQIYNWIGRPQDDFRHIAAAGIIVLLAILLSFNAVAVLIRQSMRQEQS